MNNRIIVMLSSIFLWLFVSLHATVLPTNWQFWPDAVSCGIEKEHITSSPSTSSTSYTVYNIDHLSLNLRSEPCESWVKPARRDLAFTSLKLHVPDIWLAQNIEKYRIQWFNWNWSPRYTAWKDDIDRKDNCGDKFYLGGEKYDPNRPDECARRVWSYFSDHKHEIVCKENQSIRSEPEPVAPTQQTPSKTYALTDKQKKLILSIHTFIEKNYTPQQQVALLPELIDAMQKYENKSNWSKKVLASALKKDFIQRLGTLQSHKKETPIDAVSLAQCMDWQWMKMYGTPRCGFCKKQNTILWAWMEYIKKVDCDAEKQLCVDAGILWFPTRQDREWNLYPWMRSLKELQAISWCYNQ